MTPVLKGEMSLIETLVFDNTTNKPKHSLQGIDGLNYIKKAKQTLGLFIHSKTPPYQFT